MTVSTITLPANTSVKRQDGSLILTVPKRLRGKVSQIAVRPTGQIHVYGEAVTGDLRIKYRGFDLTLWFNGTRIPQRAEGHATYELMRALEEKAGN